MGIQLYILEKLHYLIKTNKINTNNEIISLIIINGLVNELFRILYVIVYN